MKYIKKNHRIDQNIIEKASSDSWNYNDASQKLFKIASIWIVHIKKAIE